MNALSVLSKSKWPLVLYCLSYIINYSEMPFVRISRILFNDLLMINTQYTVEDSLQLRSSSGLQQNIFYKTPSSRHNTKISGHILVLKFSYKVLNLAYNEENAPIRVKL